MLRIPRTSSLPRGIATETRVHLLCPSPLAVEVTCGAPSTSSTGHSLHNEGKCVVLMESDTGDMCSAGLQLPVRRGLLIKKGLSYSQRIRCVQQQAPYGCTATTSSYTFFSLSVNQSRNLHTIGPWGVRLLLPSGTALKVHDSQHVLPELALV